MYIDSINVEKKKGFGPGFENPQEFKMFPDHRIQLSENLKVTFSCEFDFSPYPFDKHECRLGMKLPFGNITVYYVTGKPIMTDKLHGLNVTSQMIRSYAPYDNLQELQFTAFGLDVQIKRHISTYILQYYLPSITVVITSSISFIIPLSAIPGRVALVVTQFLTLTNIFIYQMVNSFKQIRHQI